MKYLTLFLFSVRLVATTLTTDGTVADTASKLTSAVNGDTVQLPASGSFTWNSGVVVSNKGIILDFNSSTITRGSGSANLVHIYTHPTLHCRVTGGTFTETTTATIMSVDGAFTDARFRVDHCTFTSTAAASILVEVGTAWGLFDHCNFNAPENSEHVHNLAYGAVLGANGWTDTVTPGTIDQVYFEDCTWTNTTSFGNPANFVGNSCIQGYYGCRTVLRMSTMNMSQFDNHGGPIGGRWWEVYSNIWVCVPNANQDRYCGFRSGSGVVYGNQKIGSANAGSGNLDMSLQASDSSTYGPGKGKDSGSGPVNEPVYLWNNTANMNIGSDQLTVNVGYFLSARPSYTALTYPHPDIGGSGSSTTPIFSAGVVSSGKLNTQ